MIEKYKICEWKMCDGFLGTIAKRDYNQKMTRLVL